MHVGRLSGLHVSMRMILFPIIILQNFPIYKFGIWNWQREFNDLTSADIEDLLIDKHLTNNKNKTAEIISEASEREEVDDNGEGNATSATDNH